MNDQNILHYAKLFSKLRRDHKFGGAPHKPVLLLAVINLIRKGDITNNRIEITLELVLEFKEIWSKIVATPHTANFALPFYHLKTEPFWKLITKSGMEIPTTSSNSIRSLSALQETVAYSELDFNLFLELQTEQGRLFLQQSLLDLYFPTTKNNFQSTQSYKLVHELESQILNEDQVQYAHRIDELKNKLSNEEFQEELFIRSGVFKREIPKIYNYQCAISGMKIESFRTIQMVDACHIVPFAISKNDTISNGISLSPNLHRAFDRGLLTINDDYTVHVTNKMIENKSSFSLSQFQGKTILLPEQKSFYPSIENLGWHQRELFIF